jgi:hypothetical protein
VRISLLPSILLVAACGGGADPSQDPVATSRNGLSSTSESDANAILARSSPTSIETRATGRFGTGVGGIASAMERWRQREAACQEENCRQEIRRERERRLAFALGKPLEPIPGVPLRGGQFELLNHGRSGGLNLLPLEDGSILLESRIVTRDGSRDCQLSASGRFVSNDQAILEFTDAQGLQRRFRLLVRNARQLTLEPFEYEQEGVCGVAPSWGDYRAE